MIGLFDAIREGRLKLLVQYLEGLLGKFRENHLNWVWADRTCYGDMLFEIMGSSINKSEALLYLPKYQKYIPLKEEFTEETGAELLKYLKEITSTKWIPLE